MKKIFEDWLDNVEIDDEEDIVDASLRPENPLKFDEWRRYNSTYLIGLWQSGDIFEKEDCLEYEAKFFQRVPKIFRRLRHLLDNINGIDDYYFELFIRCELPNKQEILDDVWVTHEYFYAQNYTHYIKLGINTEQRLTAREYDMFINGLFNLSPQSENNHTWEISSYKWD